MKELREGTEILPKVQLTIAQKKAGQAILNSLDPGGRKAILFEGFRGVGKTTVIQQIEPQIISQKGEVVEAGLFALGQVTENRLIRDPSSSFVIAGTPREAELAARVLEREFSGIEVEWQPLPGMNNEETRAYVGSLSREAGSSLTDEKLADFSLGVPLLAQELTAVPDMTPDVARRLAVNYLGENLKRTSRFRENLEEGVSRFLRVEPPVAVMADLQEHSTGRLRWRHIYDNLEGVLENKLKLEARGIEEESPLFVAPESIIIYQQMLAAGESRLAQIEIFVPELPAEDFERVAKSLGMEPDQDEFYPDSHRSSRAKMFDVSFRKVNAWVRDLEQREHFRQEPGIERIKIKARKVEEEFSQGSLPIKPSEERPSGRLFLHSHEHLGIVQQPASVGWMLESLLQQRGLPYIVDNKAAGENYVYRPEEKKIVNF